MPKRDRLPAAAVAVILLLAARGGAAEPSPTPDPAATAPAAQMPIPKEAVCVVCGVREKSGPEPVAATFVYQGKTYPFCKQACKEEFRLDPEKWIKAATAPSTAEKPKPGATAVPT